MKVIKKYRLNCDTDGDVFWHLPDTDPLPTTCPNNSAHVITGVAVVVSQVKENLVEIKAVLSETGLKLSSFGFQFIALKGVQTIFDHKLEQDVKLRGGIFETEGHVMFDTITLEVVDIDNILGYGAGTVVSDYFKQWNVPKSGREEVLEISVGEPVLKNLYVRAKYNSVSSTDDVKVCVNFRGYK